MQRTLSSLDYAVDEEVISTISRALAHPVRVRILKLLAGETCCFTGELTGMIPMAQSTISQHLKVLLDAGLIQGRIDPPKVKYCIDRERWRLAEELFMGFFGPESGAACDGD
ncbi:MAG: winged helix-turn-helix transcriptional regulator [Chlorobiaceae bacterium]|nr:winged helix-turn-helix transcriptional regulator [Chlorobiaceae bacterium]